MRTLIICLSLLTFLGAGCRFVETKVEEKQYPQIGQAPATAPPPAATPTSPAAEEATPAPTPGEAAPAETERAEGQEPREEAPAEEEKPAEKPAAAPAETSPAEAPTEPAKPEPSTAEPAAPEKKAPPPQVRVAQAGREAAETPPAEAREEEKPVPGGGVEGRPPVEEGMAPRVRSGSAATEGEPEPEAALEKAGKEAGRRPEGEQSEPERLARGVDRLTRAAEGREREVEPRRTEAQAAWKAWEKAEARRAAQRQATLAALEFHLAQAEGFLGEDQEDLKGAWTELAGLRRSLGFLRSSLTRTALWHEVECAVALCSEGRTDEAIDRLNRAAELAPPAKAPDEPQTEAPAEEANQETEAEAKEGPEVDREDTPNETNAAEPAEKAEPSAASAETPSAEASAAAPEKRPGAASAETPSAEASGAIPEDLRDQLLALVKKLEEDEAQGREELAALLDQATPSEAEELIDALTAEIDYAAAALNRASWAAARTELQSIRSNVERLKKLVSAELAAEDSGIAPVPEESTEAKGESTETEEDPRFSFHPATPSTPARAWAVRNSWTWGLGVLAVVGLLALRRRWPR